ncbi:hypothetical protein R1flu_019305 [Riccia fluitans]|uniref:Secreted protein n=1 Tax=Riccia fluitans TaxID=41844 RepID=A0ABD1ZIL9_9MARC
MIPSQTRKWNLVLVCCMPASGSTMWHQAVRMDNTNSSWISMLSTRSPETIGTRYEISQFWNPLSTAVVLLTRYEGKSRLV